MKKIILFSLVLSLIGCATTQSKGTLFNMHDSIPEDKSIIYFYFSNKEFVSNSCIIVTIDSEERGCVGIPGYLKVSLEPGEHAFSFRPKALIDLGVEMRKFTYSTEPGKVYYLESKKIESKADADNALQTNYVSAFGGYTVGWVLIDEARALESLSSLRQRQ